MNLIIKEYNIRIQSDNVVQASSNGIVSPQGYLDMEQIDLVKGYVEAARDDTLMKKSQFENLSPIPEQLKLIMIFSDGELGCSGIGDKISVNL